MVRSPRDFSRLTIGVDWELVDVSRPDLPGGKIHRTREAVRILAAEATANRQVTHHPVVSPGIVIHGKPPHPDDLTAEADIGLGCDGILADLYGLFRGKSIPAAIAITVTVITVTITAEGWRGRPALVAIGLIATAVLGERSTVLRSWPTIISPKNVECVTFGAALRIGNLNDGGAAVARIAYQVLTAPAIHAREPKIRRIRRKRAGAFKATPLGHLTVDVTQGRRVPADFDLSPSIHHDLDGALPEVRTASADHIRSSLQALLRIGRSRHGNKCPDG